jgi:predicted DNA-binding ribbon-helix-helix protein
MPPVKRSLTIAGHRTSLTLEPEFWQAANTIARQKSTSLARLVEEIDQARTDNNLSSAVRIYILQNLQGTQGSGNEG